jgi:hypothetical protein
MLKTYFPLHPVEILPAVHLEPCAGSGFSQQAKEPYPGDQTWGQKPNRRIGERVARQIK